MAVALPDAPSAHTVAHDLPVEVVRSRRRRKTVQAREVEGRLQVLIPAWMSAADEARWVSEMQQRMSRRAPPTDDAALGRRAAGLAQRHGLPAPTSVRWSEHQDRRWGSCTPAAGAIRISSRLRKAPPWVVDYVVVHELAHLVVPGHDARFDALISRYPRAARAQGFLDAWGLTADDSVPATAILGLDHVQLAMPPGREAEAEAFYSGVLGIPRVAKPAPLATRGGCWFERGTLRVHLGVEEDFRAARKAHPALAVHGLEELVRELQRSGHVVAEGDGVEGLDQAYVDDPFGNRIELVERLDPIALPEPDAAPVAGAPVTGAPPGQGAAGGAGGPSPESGRARARIRSRIRPASGASSRSVPCPAPGSHQISAGPRADARMASGCSGPKY